MKIGGFQPVTLSDYPGRVAAIIFTQGCNFRCPWCHNKSLISATRSEGSLIPVEHVLALLRRFRGRLDGVVVTGGEPTIQNDLTTFLSQIKRQDYRVKLDTNGSRPCMLGTLIDRRLVDFIAMDVKAPWDIYPHVTNTALPVNLLQKSIQVIADSGIDHEFRTTAVADLSPLHLQTIAAMLPRHSRYRVQPYRTPIES